MFLKEEERLFALDGVLEMLTKKQDLEYTECGMRSGVAVNHMSKRQKDDIDLMMVRKTRLTEHRGLVMISSLKVD